jgi:UDP-glucose 4-epimerase
MAKYLVTGGAGFIGSNIVMKLLSLGQNVRVLDNFATGRRENLLPIVDKIQVIEGDLRSYHIVREAVEGVDFVLHQGALPSVPRSIKDPITTNEVNVSGTLNVLNACRETQVKRVVFASSSSVYGDSDVLPKKESLLPDPISPYATSKLAAEKYCQVFYHSYRLETVCLRYFNVFGPRQDPTSQYSAVIPRFITTAAAGRTLKIYGDGEQSRDFTYVDNVVTANLLACESQGIGGAAVNIGCQERISLNEIVEYLKEILHKDIQVQYVPARVGDVKHSFADISLASKLLGYVPSIYFLDGLRKTAEWFK